MSVLMDGECERDRRFNHDSTPGPKAALENYFSQVERPSPEEMIKVADIIGAAHREIEHTEDILSICADLARDVPDATTILAGMINIDHEQIPKRWRSDPAETRMVLSMVGHMEIGYLRAQQCAVRRGPAFPELTEKVAEIEQLINDLQ